MYWVLDNNKITINHNEKQPKNIKIRMTITMLYLISSGLTKLKTPTHQKATHNIKKQVIWSFD